MAWVSGLVGDVPPGSLPADDEGAVRLYRTRMSSPCPQSFARKLCALWPASFFLFSCGAPVGVTTLPSGGYRITCEKGIEECVSRADKICGSKGFTILRGKNASKRLGGSSSSYQEVTYLGELEIACGLVDLPAPECAPQGNEQLVHSLGMAAPAAGPPVGPARACVPGASVSCVGAAGCAGGQICLPDGSAYGACDCGASAKPSSEAPPSLAPAPARPASPELPGAQPAPQPLR